MGNKINLGNRLLFSVFVVFFANSGQIFGSELIEVNRVVAKVNDRIVTWVEIQSAMNLLSFTDKEKKERAGEFVDGKIDRLLSITAFKEKGMNIPEAYICLLYTSPSPRD